METSSFAVEKKKSVIGNMVKEEKKSLESDGNGHEDDQNHDQTNNKEEGRQHVKDERTGSKPNSPNTKDTIAKQVPSVSLNERSMEIDAENQQSCVQENEEEQLKLARAEMDEVREENERLKSVLGQLVKDYQSLHVHFLRVLEQEASKKKSTTNNDSLPASTAHYDEEPELVSLSLGTARSTEPRKKKQANDQDRKDQDQGDEILNERLKLGLDCRFDDVGDKSPENRKNSNVEDHDHSMEEQGKDQEEPNNVETWPPSKFPKTARSGGDQDDEVLQQSHLKKPRVSIRARCDTPTMNDGCQWRKYGQKIAKGNPCPRAYYRCTISLTCPVRKQVQRCADDMSVLITTYEGNHNHPLPISATAMASTTSAAAAMLTSRSSSSSSSLGTTSASANLHGLNFTLPYNNLSSSSSSSSSRSPQNNLYFPHSTITTSNSHPTITLDLTAQTTFSNFNSNRLSSTTRPSPSCLSFSNSNSSSSTFSEAFHQTPYVHPNNFFSYGSAIPNFNRPTNNLGNIVLRQQNPSPEQFYNQQYGQNPTLTDTIAAATKAITSNPTFRSALTAALTSYVGNGARENRGAGSPASVAGGFPFAQTGSAVVGCGSSFLNKSPGLGNAHHTHQQGSLVLFPPPVRQVSGSKSGSGSPPDDNKTMPSDGF